MSLALAPLSRRLAQRILCYVLPLALPVLVGTPVRVSGQELEVPAGVGPLPDLQGGAKVGALVTKGYIDRYRAVIPPELAELLDRDEFAFEAVLRPRSAELFGESQTTGLADLSVDAKGILDPVPTSADVMLFSVPSTGTDLSDTKGIAYRVLWNTTVHQWKLRTLSARVRLLSFAKDSDDGKRVDFAVGRIYPAALGLSPGSLKPLFREKISAEGPTALVGLTWLSLRFIGAVSDYLWAASPITGQVRQMTGSNRADSIFSGAFSPDDLFVWSGKVEAVDPTSITSVTMLVPVVEGDPSVQPAHEQGCGATDFVKAAPIDLNLSSRRFGKLPVWVPTNIRMVPRRLWRIEIVTRDPFSLDARQTLYIDAETFLPVYRVVWDQDGRLRKFIIGIIGRVPTREKVGPGWRGEIIVSPGASSRAVLTLQSLETCSQLPPGKTLKEFDPSTIGSSRDATARGDAKPNSQVVAEPVDE